MPWSDWITPDPESWSCQVARGVSARNSGAGYDDADAGAAMDGARAILDAGAGDATTDLYGDNYALGFPFEGSGDEAAEVIVEGSDFHAIASETQVVKWFDTTNLGGVGVANVRNWFPPYLDGLTYGVDYIERPDRDPLDEDVFVEYEAGDSEQVGWFATASVTIALGQLNAGHTDIATGQVVLETGWSTPAILPGFTEILSSDPVWSTGGTVVADVAGTEGDTSGLVDFSTIVPLQPSLAVVALAPRTASDVVLDGSDAYQRHWRATGTVNVRANIQYPRFRYWRPGEPYVRLLHRGDGLGLSSRRLRQRGHTNQAGRLRGGY